MTTFLQLLRASVCQLATYAGLVLFAIYLLLSLGVALPVILLTTRPANVKVRSRRYISWLFRLYLRPLAACRLMYVEADQLDALANEKSLIVAANHPSMLDAVMIISRLPNASCIMKSSLMNNPLLGLGARMAGYIRNDSTPGLVRSACEDLAAGSHLVVFPEGTRTVTGPVNELRGAFATIAKQAQVPVQLLMIESTSQFLGKGWPVWRRSPVFPLRYRITVIDRINAQLPRKEIVAQTDAAMRRAIGTGPFNLNPQSADKSRQASGVSIDETP